MNEATQCDEQSLWRGSIQLVYSNDSANEVVVLGGACFKTKAEMDASWAHIPEHVHTEGEPWCMADYCMPNGDITGDKQVSPDTCAALMGRPFAELVAEGLAWNAAGNAIHLASFAAKHGSERKANGV